MTEIGKTENIEIVSDKPKRGRPKKSKPELKTEITNLDEQLIPIDLPDAGDELLLFKEPTSEARDWSFGNSKEPSVKSKSIENEVKRSKKIKDDIFKAFINNPKETRNAIINVGEGSDVMNELNSYSIEKLELVQKAIMFECSKKIDDKMVGAIVEQTTSIVDLLLKLDGNLKQSVSESNAIRELTKDTISNSFIIGLSPVVKLIGAYGSHIYTAWKIAHRNDPVRISVVENKN